MMVRGETLLITLIQGKLVTFHKKKTIRASLFIQILFFQQDLTQSIYTSI